MVRPSHPNPLQMLDQLGSWILKIVWPNSMPTYQLIELVVPLAFIVAVGLSLLLFYRTSAAGIRVAFTKPKLFHLIHGPWWGPATFLAYSVVILYGLQFYRPGAARWLPQNWPPAEWFTPSSEFVERVLAADLILVFFAIGILIRRHFREPIHDSSHGNAGWASRSQIRIQKNWLFALPIVVSWRGIRAYWSWAKQPKETWLRQVFRFVPKILSGSFTAIAPSWTTIWEHFLLLGQTGSGKGMGIFGAIIASCRCIFAYQDVKAECPGHDRLWRMTGLEPIRFGRAAVGGWPSMRWNPLREALNDPEPEDSVAALASMLMPESRPGGNDFVKAAARPLLTHCLLSGKFATLADLRSAIRDQGLTKVLTDLQTPPGYMAALQGKNMTEYVTDAFLVALTPYSIGWGRRTSSAHDFTLEDFFDRGGFILSAETDPTLNLPVQVFWRFLFRRMLASNRKLKMLLLMDEALAAGPLRDADNALVTLRSKEVSIWYGVQNLSGLRDVYGGGDKGQRVIDSFNNSITLLHALNDNDRAALMKNLDTCTVMEKKHGGMGKVPVSAPLISSAELQRRGRVEEEFWAVLRVTGISAPSNPIIGRLVPTTGQLVRTPTDEEREAALQRYGQASAQADPGSLDAAEAAEYRAMKALPSPPNQEAQYEEAESDQVPSESDASDDFWR